MIFITKKWQKLMDYLMRLEMRYDDEIHNRDMAIHQYAMNSLNDKKNKEISEGERKCNEDKEYLKAKVDVVKEIKKYVDNV